MHRGGQSLDLITVVTDLTAQGICRLMVEGGQNIHTQFLAAGLVYELPGRGRSVGGRCGQVTGTFDLAGLRTADHAAMPTVLRGSDALLSAVVGPRERRTTGAPVSCSMTSAQSPSAGE